MGISDYIWPFERKFSEIPCAREAGIAGLLGGPGLGAVVMMLTGKPSLVYKTTVNGSFVVFWLSFIILRSEYFRVKKASEDFQEAVETGKID